MKASAEMIDEPAQVPRSRPAGAVIAALRSRLDRPFTHPAALALMALTLALVAWLRMSPESRGAIWAEDGRDFLAEAVRDGPVRALGIPYAGYMHLIPRIIAGTASLLPPEAWAQGLTAASCLAAGLLGLVVYGVTAQLPIVPWARLMLAAITVLVPTLVAEVLGNAANMYTFALWCGFWLFLWRPRRMTTSVLGGILAVLLCGTAIQIVALLPLLAFRWSGRRIPVAAGAFVGLAIQLWGYLHSVRESRPSWPALGAINDGYLHQIALGSWIESAHAGAVVIVRLGWIAAALAFVPYALAAVLLWRATTDARLARVLAIALLGGSYVYWFAFFALNDLAIDYSNQSPVGLVIGASTLRYAVFPSMLLWALLVVAMGWRRVPGEFPDWWGRVRVGVVVVLVLAAGISFVGQGTIYRSRGPEWSTQLSAAQAKCSGMAPSDDVAIRIAPVGAPWTLTVACRVIESP